MDDRQGFVRVFVDADLGFDEVSPVALLWDLQNPAFVGHGVVVGDDPPLLYAERVIDVAHDGNAVRSLFGRPHGEAFVVRVPVNEGHPQLIVCLGLEGAVDEAASSLALSGTASCARPHRKDGPRIAHVLNRARARSRIGAPRPATHPTSIQARDRGRLSNLPDPPLR